MSMLRAKPRLKLVRIETQDAINGRPQPAIINERGRAPIRQLLNADTRAQMGDDRVAYFNAERIGNIWFVGERQRGGWRW